MYLRKQDLIQLRWSKPAKTYLDFKRSIAILRFAYRACPPGILVSYRERLRIRGTYLSSTSTLPPMCSAVSSRTPRDARRSSLTLTAPRQMNVSVTSIGSRFWHSIPSSTPKCDCGASPEDETTQCAGTFRRILTKKLATFPTDVGRGVDGGVGEGGSVLLVRRERLIIVKSRRGEK